MSLTIGSRFGVFEVQSLLGVGGMGEVYRASDTRLGRDVALKVIPSAVAADRQRLERFTREARALAALTHPAIGAIYDVAEHGETRALVLELVEGATLDERLQRGPLSMGEALTIARTVAEALDAAHDKGLVHRDLKPGNIKLTPAGDVKVLDFGLAKLGDEHGATTSTVDGTIPGAILGTAAYMSPEQARGQAVDKRADVWAFGCLLFEMLSGQPAFGGGTWSDSIARTLTAEPDWALLPKGTPLSVARLIERCLQKDPRQRLRGLGGVELAFDERTAVPRHRMHWPWAAAAVVLVLAGGAWTVWRDRGGAVSAGVMPIRFEIPPSIQIAENGSFALSPDGRRLVFIGTSVDGRFGLWERSMESLETTPISGAAGEVGANSTLFWSPDSRVIGFYADGAVKRIDRRGGQVQIVCRVPSIAVGGTWNQRDEIVVGNTAGGLLRCPAGGGDPVPVVEPNEAGGMRTVDLFPVFLPDGRRVLYLRLSRADPSGAGLYIADLDRPAGSQSRARLIETGFGGRFAPAGGDEGHILFMRNRGLWALPFDTRRLVTTGEPFMVVESIGTFRDWGFFDTNGSVLVHREGIPDFPLTVRDRRGGDLGRIGEAGQYTGVALSPDGRYVAARRDDPQNRSAHDLWLIDVQRNTTRRLTSDGFAESVPAWTPDSQSLVYARGAESADIRDSPLDGGQARILVSARELEGVRVNPLFATTSVGAGGDWVAYTGETLGSTRFDIWMIRVGPTAQRPRPIVVDEADQTQPALAPNGAWLAYVSNESGVSQVMVRPLRFGADGVPSAGGATAVSRGGGQAPRWRADGKELYFRAIDGGVMAVAVDAGTIGTPARLFTIQGALAEWSVASNGERFVFAVPDDVKFTVVLNWQSALR